MHHALAVAKESIARAMAADNDEPWAYLAQGMVGFATHDDMLATTTLNRAVALNPNFAYAHGALGCAHAFGGRPKEALACIDYAVRLSPREVFLEDLHLFYAFAHFQAGNYELGLKFAQLASRERSGHPYPLLMGCACASHLGDLQAAESFLQELRAMVPTVSAAWVEATAPYVHASDRAQLIEGLVRAGLT